MLFTATAATAANRARCRSRRAESPQPDAIRGTEVPRWRRGGRAGFFAVGAETGEDAAKQAKHDSTVMLLATERKGVVVRGTQWQAHHEPGSRRDTRNSGAHIGALGGLQCAGRGHFLAPC